MIFVLDLTADDAWGLTFWDWENAASASPPRAAKASTRRRASLRRPGDPDRCLLEKVLDRPGGRFEAGAALAGLGLVILAWALLRLRSWLPEGPAGTAPSIVGIARQYGLAQMTTDQAPGSPRAERIRHSASEIAYILELLKANNEPITTHLHGGALGFTSRLRVIDPAGSRIIIEASPDEAANAALLSRPRCSFFASVPGGHV
jgi:hypothetical protein